ncbi:MAG TPA: hypothetical protein VEW72_10060 [Burkholderiales bacterium]|nr:hypothetical protein [Burkholderiales bacterium]
MMPNLTFKDLLSMRMPLLVLGIVILLSASLIKYTSSQHAAAEVERVTQTSALEDARSRFQRSGDERELILRYLPDYQKLQQSGFVGSERRIEWIESLRASNKKAGLFGVTYQMDVRKPFPLLGQGNPIAPSLRHSPMKLSMGLVHEGDLLRFLQLLSAQPIGMYFLTGCTIDRPTRSDAPAPRHANLTAQCDMSWLTVDTSGKTGS